jgi:hypothetical protein
VPKYKVQTALVEIEADNPEDAVDKYYDQKTILFIVEDGDTTYEVTSEGP